MTGYRLAWPLIRHLDPERAHGLALMALKTGLLPRPLPALDPVLRSPLFGLDFATPVGLAAGFDKDAVVPDSMLAQGFGFVEVGSLTPRPQPGNPKPRLFRLEADRAVINRMGFNNHGMDTAARRLAARRRRGRGGIVGVNLGKNKETENALDDYVKGVARLGPFADYLVVNVSSPNTPGLRALQGREPLAELLRGVMAERDGLANRPPLLLKVAPDLTAEDKADIAQVALDTGIDGLIATNTTIERPATLLDARKTETGGLSGAPLLTPSTAVLADFYRLTEGGLPLIGVGGIQSGWDAYRKIRAGASLVQLYSAMVYEGPGLAARVARELATHLRRGGFSSVAQAVGADHR